MKTYAVIGKNFGDEGKGLACASLSLNIPNTLIVKHNGGGQAGHTVESKEKRFVHHQIGSGAEYGAATLFADTFRPDLYKLIEEVECFKIMFGFIPIIYAEKDTKIVTIDDVLRNMLIESGRGKDRHGSCGMGIDECNKRIKKGNILTLDDVQNMSKTALYERLKSFRNCYEDLEILEAKYQKEYGKSSEYYELLKCDEVLMSYVEQLKQGLEYITLVDASKNWLMEFDQIVFESGQGLLLDEDYAHFAPHLTSSKTGLNNIAHFLDKRSMKLDEAIYVTRTYVTRHGNGPLPCEDETIKVHVKPDLTNISNEWQGSIRYAKHESLESFIGPVKDDFDSVKNCQCMKDTKKSLLITHLDETENLLWFAKGNIFLHEFEKIIGDKFDNIYKAQGRYRFDPRLYFHQRSCEASRI